MKPKNQNEHKNICVWKHLRHVVGFPANTIATPNEIVKAAAAKPIVMVSVSDKIKIWSSRVSERLNELFLWVSRDDDGNFFRVRWPAKPNGRPAAAPSQTVCQLLKTLIPKCPQSALIFTPISYHENLHSSSAPVEITESRLRPGIESVVAGGKCIISGDNWKATTSNDSVCEKFENELIYWPRRREKRK